MSHSPKDKSSADLDLASLAATLDDIRQTFLRIPHLTHVAEPLGQAVCELETATRQSMGTIPDPTEAERRRRGYPH